VEECQERKGSLHRRTHFDNVPVKPQRVYEEMNKAFGSDTCYVSSIGLSQIAAAQFLHVYKPRHWINCGQAGPLGWTICKALGVTRPEDIQPALKQAEEMRRQFQVPIIVEVMLERVTNIAMGTEIDAIMEFEDLAQSLDDAPAALALLD